MKTDTAAVVPEVIEKCPGMRRDGTCGNGMSDNHNRPCRGVNCPDRKQYEQNYGRSTETSLAAQNAGGIVRTIAQQIEAVRGAELRSTFEKIKLGAMVKQAVTLLGLEGRGNGHAGDGIKGWWESNFKGPDGQPMIPYQTLMRWIAAAERLPRLLDLGKDVTIRGREGRIPMMEHEVMALLAKDPEQVIAKSERKVLESAEKVANGMTLRQMLLWGDDAPAKRPGRPVGSVSQKPKVDTNDPPVRARAEWSRVIAVAAENDILLRAAARLLSLEDVENGLTVLRTLIDYLNERQRELKHR